MPCSDTLGEPMIDGLTTRIIKQFKLDQAKITKELLERQKLLKNYSELAVPMMNEMVWDMKGFAYILKRGTSQNHPQPPTTTHNHPKPAKTNHNHPAKTITTSLNHPQQPKTSYKPSTTSLNGQVYDADTADLLKERDFQVRKMWSAF